MKTYKKTIEAPRLLIEYDDCAESPRGWDNIGHFFTREKRYNSPDGNTDILYKLMLETAEDAKNADDHIRLMKLNASTMFKNSEPKDGNSHDEHLHIIDIFPVYRYEHGGVSYKRGTAQGFDYSTCGFYIVTAQSISGATYTTEDIEKAIDNELETYTQWCNREVYRFVLYDENGEVSDSCGGFYDIEDIRDLLPEDLKNERLDEYMV